MVRTAMKATAKSVEAKDKNVNETFKAAQSTVDKMVSKGVIHKNKAARLKSRMNKQIKSV